MLPRRALIFPLAAPVAAQDEGGAHARVARKFHVAVAVADHPTLREVEIKIARRSFDQTGLRLATITVKLKGRHADRWMMRAIVDRIEPRTLAFKFLAQYAVHHLDQIFCEVAARHARLIRDEDGAPAQLVEQFDRFGRVREDAIARQMIDVADLFRDRPIAINEDGALLHPATSAWLGHVMQASNACARSKTNAGVMAVMQRWSI